MAVNAGLMAWHAKRRAQRRAAMSRIDARMDAAGIPQEKRAETRNAYRDYLVETAAGGTWSPARYRDAMPLPAGVQSAPAVNWSDYDLAADYG